MVSFLLDCLSSNYRNSSLLGIPSAVIVYKGGRTPVITIQNTKVESSSHLCLLTLIWSVIFFDCLDWYQEALTKLVVSPYVHMHNILQTRIIAPLLSANSDLLNTDEAATTSLVTTVSCGATQLQAGLRQTLRSSERLGRIVEKLLHSLVAKVSATEIQLQQARNQVLQGTYEVELSKSKVREGEADVSAKQIAVNAADAVVREAQGNGKKLIFI